MTPLKKSQGAAVAAPPVGASGLPALHRVQTRSLPKKGRLSGKPEC